ncbi:uncharacterized protein LOC109858098 isoform X2 [Pseudomyrmex gracilis]|uniref:uncharacterized protein LOC109858098 isoform X2 n=1 Tax=Pseudomyrmex gracilis TaxID=219809 RepID=UPI000995CCC2|nr:uncharacterized protein LOC109858098 isoform X2 [Pseudomyrmex gracilis]
MAEKKDYLFTPIKTKTCNNRNEINTTIVNTPLPQASSTVQRKPTRENTLRISGQKRRHNLNVTCENKRTEKETDSSLGILRNISTLASISAEDGMIQNDQTWKFINTDVQVENARKLLQRYSNISTDFSKSVDTNKENDPNVQNLTGKLPFQGSVRGSVQPRESYTTEGDQKFNTNRLTDKDSINSLIFEPTEITARSSEVTSSSITIPLNKSCNATSFASEEIMAQLNNDDIMAQINEENFLSGSKLAEKLSVDEACWQQDHTYVMPAPSTEKQQLELSSFSGIFGQHNLSVESCAGQKLSVGQYFGRKSNNVGGLGKNEKIRPSLGFAAKSPVKRGILQPLVESTVSDESIKEQQYQNNATPNVTIDADKNSVISLSTIVNILNDNSVTPRRLVDEILMAQRKKEGPSLQSKNETLVSDKKSMLATSTQDVTKIDENISSLSEDIAKKLSLDSRIKNDSKTKTDMKRSPVSFVSNKTIKEESESFQKSKEKLFLEEAAGSKHSTSSMSTDFELLVRKSTSPVNQSYLASEMSKYSIGSYEDLKIPLTAKKETKRGSDISDRMSSSSSVKTLASVNLNEVVIGKNSENLCNCIVGMTREANVELINNSSKWITTVIKVIEVEGARKCIKVIPPPNEFLIKPNKKHSSKIKVKVTRLCEAIFLTFNIKLSDMVGKQQWSKRHMICINPEELELDITCNNPELKNELNFEYIPENSFKILPIVLHNKNNVDLPVNLFILYDEPEMFSIDCKVDESVKLLKKFRDKSIDLLLKARKQCTVYVKCEKLQSTPKNFLQKQLQHLKNILVVRIQCNDSDTTLLRKEIPLYGMIGICEIQIIDTELPLIVSKHQGKLLNVINSGSVATHVTATIVPSDEEHTNATQDFSVKPDNIYLKAGETDSFLIVYKPQISDANSADNERHAKIKLVAGINVYYYDVIGVQQSLESERENFLRCHTPINAASLSPVTSPQSVTSSRNSPTSTVSSVAVAGNIIPVRTTHAALVWKSVKIGKCEIKEFTIRNTSDNKIKIQLDICDDNKNFKFYGDRQVSTSMVVTMQRQESKTLAVAFSPYYIGPISGKITIRHYIKDSNNQQHKIIKLFGYGGYSKINISGTFKDSSAKMWLSLGTLYSETTILKATFVLQNNGDLYSFATIKIAPKVISPTMDNNWNIKPKELILHPKETRRVSIEFYPKKEDHTILQRSEVSHVATVHITYGDEPTRLRIRRLVNKSKEAGDWMGNEKETFKNIVLPICKVFPGEEIVQGLLSIRDSVQNLSDLCTGVHQHEVMLTVEKCIDETLPVHYDTDESQMFYSLISDTTDTDEEAGTSFFVNPTAEDCEVEHPEEHLTVTPSTVILNPPILNEATVNIFSLFKTAQPFQTNLLDSNFSVLPTTGMLPSKTKFPLKIQCSQRIDHNMDTVLEVYTENEKVNVPIKIIVKKR